MTASDRIQSIIRSFALNAKTFSEKCGYDRPQVVYDIIKGKTRNISSAMADRIVDAFPEINRVWLLTGEGSMMHSDVVAEPEEMPQVKTVPLVPLSAIAGPLTSYFESGVDLRRCARIPSLSPDAEIALPISGDSMEPVFADGSVVFIKRINEAAFIPWGHPLVLDTENGIFIKIVMPDDTNPQYLWAESTNPRYPHMHVPKLSIFGLYRVLSVTKSYPTM